MEKAMGRRVYHRGRGQKAVLGEREKRRLIQLGVCLALFLTVFFAKGLDRLTELRSDLRVALQNDVDFEAAFADVGWSLASGKSMGKTLNELWANIFLPQEKQSPEVWGDGPLYQATQKELSQGKGSLSQGLKGMAAESGAKAEDPMASSGSKILSESKSMPEEKPEAEPAMVHVDYTGPALPDNTTMDRYTLGLPETVAPVSSAMTSEFGWREHPISGGEKFHYGIDLRAEEGTTVHAFAAGTVDYIGESDVYGQYLQLRHDNGVTSFYAHCSKLCVQKGQQVGVGEKVAESGATGDVTGPHLHFEMKKDGVRLNPAYYIQLSP